jgi:thioredoxin-dependent peroxiredoxin
MAVQEGAAAPKFELVSDTGAKVTSSDYAGRWLVLYFYPRDNTPGCTREAHDFTAAASRLNELGADVVGVSRDSVQSHQGFKGKCKIGFTLLSDPALAAHRAFGAWGTKTMYGKKVEGVIRSTFLVAPDGTVARVWSGVKVDGHVDKVIAALEAHRDGASSRASASKTGKKPVRS